MNRAYFHSGALAGAAGVIVLVACNGAEVETAVAEPAEEVSAVAPTCEIDGVGSASLPEEVRETSGLAQSLIDPDIFWTHNDAGNDAEIYALNPLGELVGTVRIQGAELEDWEDIEAAPCENGSCLYIADSGDNDGERDEIVVYRVAEPLANARESVPAVKLRLRFPDGPRDAEALFVHPTAGIHIVTKGRRGPVELYRYPGNERPDQRVTLERVGQLFPYPDAEDRVTAATTTSQGRWIAIRSYRTLYLFTEEEIRNPESATPREIDLTALDHEQGESISITSDGIAWLTSEAESGGDPVWSRIRCVFP